MHNLAPRRRRQPATLPAALPRPGRAHLSATHAVRAARPSDVVDIVALVELFAADGRMLPRTAQQIMLDLDSFVVVVDGHHRVQACAALYEYSPSLGEIGCVAVHPDAQGQGLGSMAVRGAEATARRRGVGEVFALSLAKGFFESLGYTRTHVQLYPEKLARYAELERRGTQIVPKTCYRKVLNTAA